VAVDAAVVDAGAVQEFLHDGAHVGLVCGRRSRKEVAGAVFEFGEERLHVAQHARHVRRQFGEHVVDGGSAVHGRLQIPGRYGDEGIVSTRSLDRGIQGAECNGCFAPMVAVARSHRAATRIGRTCRAEAGAFFAARDAKSAAGGVANAARGALSAARGAESAGDDTFRASRRVESAVSHAFSADDRAKRAARHAFCAARGEKSVMFRASGNVESRSGSGFRVEHGPQDSSG